MDDFDISIPFMTRGASHVVREVWTHEDLADRVRYNYYKMRMLEDELITFPLDVVASMNNEDLARYLNVRGYSAPPELLAEECTSTDIILAHSILDIDIRRDQFIYTIYLNLDRIIQDPEVWTLLMPRMNVLADEGIIDQLMVQDLMLNGHAHTVQALLQAGGLVQQFAESHDLDAVVINMCEYEHENSELVIMYQLYKSRDETQRFLDIIENLSHLDLELAMYLIHQGHRIVHKPNILMSTEYKISITDLNALVDNYGTEPFINTEVLFSILSNINYDDDPSIYRMLMNYVMPRANTSDSYIANDNIRIYFICLDDNDLVRKIESAGIYIF